MRHCNSIFNANDIWFLSDNEKCINRRLYLAICPICNKKMALYSYFDTVSKTNFEQAFYSGGVAKIKEKLKKDITSTMLGFKNNCKMPFGFKYGKNVEIKKDGKITAIEQYACDFYGNKVLVKRING